MLETIQSLFWPSLGPMEQLSIRSFLAHGHPYHLYAYGDVTGVPTGCIVKDANEIMPYTPYEHHAQFADIFRYTLLLMRGGYWADTDVVCLKPFDFKQPVVFSSEHANPSGGQVVNNVIMKAPQNLDAIRWLLSQCKGKPEVYTSFGPLLMEQMVTRFNVQQWVKKPEVFCPIPWFETASFLEHTKLPDSHALHLWHGKWNQESRPTNVFSGLYADLQAQYGSGEGKTLITLITCKKNAAKRDLVLSTWAKTLPPTFDLKVCDGQALGVDDSYEALVDKTKAAVHYTLMHDYEYMLKCDDDTYLRTAKLKVPDAHYAGWVTDSGVKEFPLAHCQGGAYWLDRDAMFAVVTSPLNDITAEDRWVGQALAAAGIKPHHLPDYVMDPHIEWATHWRASYEFKPDWTAMLQVQLG